MTRESRIQERVPWRSVIAGAVGCAAAGAVLFLCPVGDALAGLGYDWAHWFRQPEAPSELVIVYLDEDSYKRLGQQPKNWDRKLYAGLLDWLTREGARLVVLDVVLRDEGPSGADLELARAMRDNGKVVLAAAMEKKERPDIRLEMVVLPRPLFTNAAAGWGISALRQEGITRYYEQGEAGQPSLPWAAAVVTGAPVTRHSTETGVARWLNFYGPPGILHNVRFAEATNQPSGFFKDKCVFVGSRPAVLFADDLPDQFLPPHARWSSAMMAGVEVMATGFLNLQRGDWLERMPARRELVWMIGLGILFGGGLCLVRPFPALGFALAGMLAVALAGVVRTWAAREWSAWTIPAVAQIPLALGWSVLIHTKRLRREVEDLERGLIESVGGAGAIPDHTLLCRIGRGAYGEVWLARNAVGIFRAVKVVRRRWFQNDHHYEREFQGIRKFLPISGSHPGMVHVLHVGRRDEHGYFYYVMEAADDATTGQTIHPDRYVPCTLAHVLRERGRLPVEDCRRLGVALADALEHLHGRQLIHRDIKPANILFVAGRPNLADIGLVTDFDSTGAVSQVGTLGYVAPEGPGPASDVYSLGMVLYEATMGMDAQSFPELPTAVYDAPDYAMRKKLNEVIAQACAHRCEDRYRSAGELKAALQDLRFER